MITNVVPGTTTVTNAPLPGTTSSPAGSYTGSPTLTQDSIKTTVPNSPTQAYYAYGQNPPPPSQPNQQISSLTANDALAISSQCGTTSQSGNDGAAAV